MYAYPTTPQVWGNITKASCLDELIDLVDLAHDLGHEERDFWIRENGQEFHIGISRRDNATFRLRYKDSNAFEVGGRGLLADRLGEAMSDDRVFSLVMEGRGSFLEPTPIRQARHFIERHVPAHQFLEAA